MDTIDQLLYFQSNFPWVWSIWIFIFGACWGSFLNVVVYRMPRNLSVVKPRSFCTSSGKPIPWYDNIPILSWLILRGRSRHDKEPINPRYPIVEGLTGLLFVVSWWTLPPSLAIVSWVFICILLPATFIDLEFMQLPDVLTVGGMCVGLILSIIFPSLHGYALGNPYMLEAIQSLITAIIGVLIGSAVLLWIAMIAEMILKREAMGFGDVLFMGCIGAFCGWPGALFAIFGGALIGTIVIIPMMILQKLTGKAIITPGHIENKGEGEEDAKIGAGTAIPFGPWLAVGALFYFILLRQPVNAYFENFRLLLFNS